MAHFNQIHAQIITTGIHHDVFAASRLLKFSSCTLNPSNISLTHLIFSNIQSPDVFSYNLMIKAYSQAAFPLTSVSLYRTMLYQGLRPNEYTLCFLLTSCANGQGLNEGKQAHGHLIKHGLGPAVFAATSLIHMYGECCAVYDACRVFDEMPQRSDASWGAIIGAYVSCGHLIEGLRLFGKMRSSGIGASDATLVSTLYACAKLGGLVLGRMIHSHVVVNGIELNATLGTGLLDMYAKCGAVDMAMDVFRAMPAKSVPTWNSMIHGLAMNSRGRAAVALFKEMQATDVQPNGVTFIGVLHACSHAGLVDAGAMYFSSMLKEYGVAPNVKHYGCLVDLFGRAGHMREALDVIRAMPMEADVVIWGALFGACRIYGHTRLGELVAAQIMKLQSQRTCGYVLLSDMYAMADRWDDVVGVRKMMMEMDTRKMPGRSFGM
ncbi:pentatricopeptide repeat-containing protein At4g21065-like [Magnolia sinica]|uniref:pentatricopeptide repeat-containing protein At4g21065-like n=1 Tax=Magnolia sinica TaxID=86752 RepID=UPI002659582E|nr:pentatricopeptide repeat-containing protein At4g21065-like [Magnolia sinica]